MIGLHKVNVTGIFINSDSYSYLDYSKEQPDQKSFFSPLVIEIVNAPENKSFKCSPKHLFILQQLILLAHEKLQSTWKSGTDLW